MVGLALVMSGCAPSGGRNAQTGSLPASPQSDVVRIGLGRELFPPFYSQNVAGEWVGFDVDISQAICQVEQLNCQIVPLSWDRLIPELQGKRIDVIWSSMQITDARKQIINFTDVYYEMKHVLIGRASDPTALDPADPSSLKGKIIGAQTGTVAADFLRRRIGEAAEIRLYSTLNDALGDLKAGRVDYVSDFAFSFTSFLVESPDFAVAAIWPVDPILNQGIAGALRRDNEALRAKFNRGLAAIMKSGKYDEILRTYPGLADEIRRPGS
jgi:polar amino acid transport system substrate-binding protein